MPMRVSCPQCGAIGVLAETSLNRRVQCSNCQMVFRASPPVEQAQPNEIHDALADQSIAGPTDRRSGIRRFLERSLSSLLPGRPPSSTEEQTARSGELRSVRMRCALKKQEFAVIFQRNRQGGKYSIVNIIETSTTNPVDVSAQVREAVEQPDQFDTSSFKCPYCDCRSFCMCNCNAYFCAAVSEGTPTGPRRTCPACGVSNIYNQRLREMRSAELQQQSPRSLSTTLARSTSQPLLPNGGDVAPANERLQ